jgi:glucosamine-6-phosphate deaminase
VEVIILSDAEGIAEVVSSWITDLVRQQPRANLGLATGSTPEKVYQAVASGVRKGELSFAQCQAFLLDE